MAIIQQAWLAALLFSLVCIASDGDLFIFPTAPGPSDSFVADLSWEMGSNQTIQWSTTVDSYQIALYQQQVNPASGAQVSIIYTTEDGAGTDQSYTWQVDTGSSSITFSPYYFLWLNPGSGFTSHYFNITAPSSSSSATLPKTSSTTASSQSRSTTSPTSSTIATISSSLSQTIAIASSSISSTTAAAATANDANTSANAGSSGSNTNMDIGLGVGLGVGIPLILLAGVWLGMLAVKQRRASSRGGSEGKEDPASSRWESDELDRQEKNLQKPWPRRPDQPATEYNGFHEAASHEIYEVSEKGRRNIVFEVPNHQRPMMSPAELG